MVEAKFLMEQSDIVAERIKFLWKMNEFSMNVNTLPVVPQMKPMLMNLEEQSIIVMDNASYHSSLVENYPKSNSRKTDVQQQRKKQRKKYKLNELTFQMGQEVVRFPPYHCQYNPIELIWAKVKGKAAEKKSTFIITDVEAFEQIDAVSREDRAKCGTHCVKIQEDYFIKV